MSDKEQLKQFKQFEIKDSVAVEGITENYFWYESQILREAMQSWLHRFEKLVRVAEARHGEHLVMVEQLIKENKALKQQLKEKT